jgi:hypothetical protein
MANIGAAPFIILARRSYIGVTSLYEVNAIIDLRKKKVVSDDEDKV